MGNWDLWVVCKTANAESIGAVQKALAWYAEELGSVGEGRESLPPACRRPRIPRRAYFKSFIQRVS